MNMQAYIDEVKLRLTGNLLEIELDDATIAKVVNSALREMQRYVCSVGIITIPFSRCIDLSKQKNPNGVPIKVSAVTNIFRANSFSASDSTQGVSFVDPMYGSLWQMISPAGNMYNYQNYVYDYAAWNTMIQIRNTSSTDLSYYFDKSNNKLYINVMSSDPAYVTIEYIPRFDSVEDVVSDYWIDFLVRLSVALTKVTLGRIRSRYTQNNALYSQDGQILLEEGNSELAQLREYLSNNNQLLYPVD